MKREEKIRKSEVGRPETEVGRQKSEVGTPIAIGGKSEDRSWKPEDWNSAERNLNALSFAVDFSQRKKEELEETGLQPQYMWLKPVLCCNNTIRPEIGTACPDCSGAKDSSEQSSEFRVHGAKSRKPVSSIKYQASSIQYQASSIQHPASSIQYPASSIRHLADNLRNRFFDTTFARFRKIPT